VFEVQYTFIRVSINKYQIDCSEYNMIALQDGITRIKEVLYNIEAVEDSGWVCY